MRIFVVFSLIFCFSCTTPSADLEQQKKKGERVVVTEQYDGSKTEVTYIPGKIKHGPARIYYPDGTLKLELTYENGLQEGISKLYYKEGSLYQETPYENGSVNGTRKKYFRNGNLMSEIPFKNSHPGIGLKEYTIDGKVVSRNPRIEFTITDRLKEDNRVYINGRLSDGSTNVEFFVGGLVDGRYLHDDLKEIPSKNGVMEIVETLEPGQTAVADSEIIAVLTTPQRNKYITVGRLQYELKH